MSVAHAVILAGGRGTRFWPRSRLRQPKQLLRLFDSRSLLQQTVDRIRPLFPPERIWVVTQREQFHAVAAQLPQLPRNHLLVEPEGRNTTAAIGLVAIHLRQTHPQAVLAVLPADHLITDVNRFRRILRVAVELASEPHTLITLGIKPQWPETGYGYIEQGELACRRAGISVYRARRFVEKPSRARARRYLASSRYSWNAGMFFWRVDTFWSLLARFRPQTARLLDQLAEGVGRARYARLLRQIYPRLENISVDYAVVEPASRTPEACRVCVIPAQIGWSDVGSWAAVYALQARRQGQTVSVGPWIGLDSQGNYLWVPDRVVAAIGLRDWIVVATPDALLLCPRSRAQEVSRLVRELERRGMTHLL